MTEDPRHPPTWYRVVEIVDAAVMPDGVKALALGPLSRHAIEWDEVAVIARIVDPAVAELGRIEAPEWLVAVESDLLEVGCLVDVSGGWTASCRTHIFAGGKAETTTRVHVAARATVRHRLPGSS